MSIILIAGGTGLIGSQLVPMLRERGHTVRLLTRSPKGPGQFAWDPEHAALIGTDVIINLAGAGIAAGRWTPARRQTIINSRVQGAQVLRDAMLRIHHKPECYIAASAIGYYGNSAEQNRVETDPPGATGFTAETGIRWEQATAEVATLGMRTVIFRIGIVLAKEGGALPEIVRPIRFGVAAYFADGQSWYSWIHRTDVCRLFAWAAENQSVQGVYNAVAPNPARNKDLTRATARALNRGWAIMIPTPAFVLRLILGEMADIVLDSNRISAQKVLDAGFEFQHPDLEPALRNVLQK
jgi:uncharacterized protein